MQAKFKNLSDEDLIIKFLEGHTSFFNALISRYRSKWHYIIFLVVKDKELAEDLLQDAIMKIYYALSEGTYKEDKKFSSWAGRVCKNIAIDYLRTNKLFFCENSESNEMKDYVSCTLERIINEEDRKMLNDAINRLPQAQKEIVFLRYFDELSFKEIAQMKDISINTALGRMRYAINNLQKIIGKKSVML
jgi:RNA polymerase sigma-70 factor (ECF subfamily)